jgi:hypothetical protein
MMLALYQGRVTKTEKTKDGRWILIHVKGNHKPIGFQTSSFVGDWPHIGDKISVQATEGTFWYFGQHRTLVTVTEEAYFPTDELPNYIPDRNEMVCENCGRSAKVKINGMDFCNDGCRSEWIQRNRPRMYGVREEII